ncbi:MAG: diaminopimelate epimerase [Bacteroidetes bacterium]|nr:diaminopimelate epimerase [Bacteroidota bacterium]MBS1648275.1 diaminopimelate epimerase [Bacteroidota bacterium]
MQYTFYKYQGTGNDFIILDNREGKITLTPEQINKLCDRKFGIGADGLMMLNTSNKYDFEMYYVNADGKPSTMCGNGGRCLTKFAYDTGMKKDTYKFWAIDGEHEAILSDNNWINLKMQDVNSIENKNGDYILNTGSLHFVKNTNNVMDINVFKEGREIRYSKEFEQNGINVNFVEATDEDAITVRTYERGVENETLSCGTGATASALVYYHNETGFNRIEIKTLGGNLAVEFNRMNDNTYNNIWLCGPAAFVFKGEIEI